MRIRSEWLISEGKCVQKKKRMGEVRRVEREGEKDRRCTGGEVGLVRGSEKHHMHSRCCVLNHNC